MEQSKGIDLRTTLTYGDSQPSDFGTLIDIFAEYPTTRERIATVYHEDKQGAESIARHFCVVIPFVKVLDTWRKLKASGGLKMEEVEKLQEQFNNQMNEINAKLYE
jgi:hypothetical protein